MVHREEREVGERAVLARRVQGPRAEVRGFQGERSGSTGLQKLIRCSYYSWQAAGSEVRSAYSVIMRVLRLGHCAAWESWFLKEEFRGLELGDEVTG